MCGILELFFNEAGT